MSHKERCEALFKSTLVILKNATIIIPVLEGMVFTIWDLIKPQKKEKKDEEKITDTSATVQEPEQVD